MVAKPHPSTVKSIEARGFTVEGGPDDEAYTVVWPEMKKRISHPDLKTALQDMILLKTIINEYPKLRAIPVKDEAGSITWALRQGKKTLAEGWPTLSEAWDAYTQEQGSEDGEDDEDETGEEGRSIVKRKYREAYRPNDHTNGDEFAQRLKAYLSDEGRMNRDRLVRFAKANKAWDDKYDRLNNGQIRMNVGNKVRRMEEKGHNVVWPK